MHRLVGLFGNPFSLSTKLYPWVLPKRSFCTSPPPSTSSTASTSSASSSSEGVRQGVVTCNLSNGMKFTIKIEPDPNTGSIATFTYDKQDDASNSNSTIESKIHYPKHDARWDPILAERNPYLLSKGKRSGQPNCRGCGSPVKDSKKLRVLVRSYFTPTNNQPPHPATYTFCPKYNCILKATETGNTKKQGAYYPPFNKHVYISNELRSLLQEGELETQTEGLLFAYGEKRDATDTKNISTSTDESNDQSDQNDESTEEELN